ncbi:MAG: carboxypeptidase M32 [Thermoplasmata archaeon]
MNLNEILEEYKNIETLSQAQRLMHWDMETNMPEKGIDFRSEAIARLEMFQQERILNLQGKVESLNTKDFTDIEKGMVRNLKRSIHYYVSIPSDIVRELSKTTSKASMVWRESRKRQDFSSFEPYLVKIVEFQKQIASYLGYEKHPYNALIDLYEEGFTVQDADDVFDKLLKETKPVLDKIIDERRFYVDHPLENKKYKTESMKKVNMKVLEILKMPMDRFRMDVSAHPFTTHISMDDVRITTRYEGINFKSTLFSTIHESGHALYELQKDPSLAWTPVAGAPSLGFHESQSRFLENMVGRSKEFVHLLYPYLRENLPFLKNYDEQDIYIYFNTIFPSLIRVDADEVTYNFHIALRYEIEKNLLTGKFSVGDLPEIWDEFMEKYLGVRPKNVSEGVLQDIHWSQGSFGYFPTYSLGNIISAIIRYKIKDLYENIRKGDIEYIKKYLREKVHRYGSIYTPKELLKISFNEGYNPDYLIKYFREKYL